MRHINITNYALLNENKSLGYYSLIEKDAAKPASTSAGAKPEGSTISILPTDSEEVKALKNVIISKTPKEAFDAIDSQANILAGDASKTQAKFSVKIGETDYKVVINKTNTPDSKIGIWIDFDSTAKLIEGLDLDYITTQLNKSADKTFLGIDFGTDEEKMASVAGAIYAYCYDKKAPAKEVLLAIGARYQERFGTSLLDMVDGEFTGSPDVFARGLFGAQLTQSDISTALGVDAMQSLLVDLTIMAGTYALTAFTAGGAAPTAVASTARVGSAFKNIATLGRAGAEVRNLNTAVTAGEEALTAAKLTYQAAKTGEVIQSASKLKNLGTAISLSAEEVNVLKGVKNFSSIERFLTATKGGAMSLNGERMAAEMAKDSSTFFQSLKEVARVAPQAVKQGLSQLDPKTAALIVGGASLAVDAIPDAVAAMKGGEPLSAGASGQMDDKKLTEMCDELHKEAKGYTGGDGELKIAFAMLSLTPDVWQRLNATWNKNHGEEGTLYDYCVSSELSGDLAVLVDGYLGGIGGVGPLANSVQTIKNNLEKGAVPAAEAQPVKEQAVITSFADFLKAR